MKKVQKTSTAALKQEAVRLAQTSGKSIAQVAPAPNRKWLTDITAVWTAEGWLYLAAVLDVYSRLIVGWAMASHREESLVETALWMALGRRQPAEELLHHSDRGSQYTSLAYQAVLAQFPIQVSRSKKGGGSRQRDDGELHKHHSKPSACTGKPIRAVQRPNNLSLNGPSSSITDNDAIHL